MRKENSLSKTKTTYARMAFFFLRKFSNGSDF
jgi:hypothetical protein